MQFDDILGTVGQFGRYQVYVYVLLWIVAVPNAFHPIAIVFLGGEADHWCAVPEWKADNCTSLGINPADHVVCAAAKRIASIPLLDTNSTDSGVYSQCEMYNVSQTSFAALIGSLYDNSTTGSLSHYHSLEVVPCSSGWDFDRSQYTSTINMDFGLVCSDKNLADISSSLWFVGILVGSIVFGYLADRIGRCLVMRICIACQLVVSIAVAFSPSFWWFAILRMFVAALNIAIFMMCFVLGTEFVGPSKRVIAGTGFMVAFAFGYMGLSVIAFLIRDWRHLQLAISIPSVALLLFVPFIPESTRWLLSQGRINKANVIMQKVAKTNKVDLPDPIFTKDSINQKSEEKKASVMDLFRTPNLRNESLNLALNWMVESLVYYGLALSSSDLGVNVYVAAFVSGAVEIPAYLSSIFALKYFGRRVSTCFYMVLGGTACILTICIPIGVWRAAIAMIGKFGITASFSIIYIYTAELYPTPVRSVGLGMCSMSSRIGGIIAPLIRILGRTWAPFPAIVYGSVSILAGLLALLLPETRGRKLPETIEEGENLRYTAVTAKYVEVPTMIPSQNPPEHEDSYDGGHSITSIA